MDRIKRFGRHTFSSLQIPNFRRFFINQSLSQSGMWMQTVALGWSVLEITGSGTQLGFVVALQFLPMLLLGPWGGLMSDRHDKRKLLFFTQGSFAVLLFLMGTLMVLGAMTVTLLYLYALIFGLIRLFDTPARQTFVSELVEPEALKNAVSLNATINNLARAVGPSIAGMIIAGANTATCFIVTSFAYVGAMITMRAVHSVRHEKRVRTDSSLTEIKEGLRYVARTPLIKNTLIMIALVGTFAFEFQVSLPILAQQTFKGNAESYALLLTSMGIGAVIGGLFAAGRHKVAPQHLTHFIFLFGGSMLLVSLMPTLSLAALGMLLVGFFSINVTSLANTMIQLESDPGMRGRVMALWVMAMAGSTPIGGPIIGFVAEVLGGRAGVAVGGLVAVCVALYGYIRTRASKAAQLKAEREQEITDEVQFNTDKATAEEAKVL